MELFKASFLLTLTLLHLGGCLVSGSQLNVCSANITEANNGSISLLYKRIAAADNSTCMHFVWSIKSNDSNDFPSLFSAQTNNTTDACTRECSSFVDKTNHTVNIPDAIDSYFSFGVVFTRLIEFIVPSDSAHSTEAFNESLNCECEKFPSNEMCQNYSMNYTTGIFLNDSNLEWSFHEANQSFMAVLLDAESGNETATRFTIRTNFPTTSEAGQRLSYFPHTLFTANTTTIDIIIENFPYNLSNISDYESKNFSRLALELYVVHGPNTQNGSIVSATSLDDEYTPSVFTTMTYEMFQDDDVDAADETGFFQWKPISYQNSDRKSTASQQVNILYTGDQSFCNTGEIPNGLVKDLFGQNASNVTRWFAVFGTSGDVSYFNNPFFTWTSIVGYGQVPEDSISMIVIVTIIVGLGIPALLVLVGAVYVVIKKKPWQNVKRVVAKATGTSGGYTKLN